MPTKHPKKICSVEIVPQRMTRQFGCHPNVNAISENPTRSSKRVALATVAMHSVHAIRVQKTNLSGLSALGAGNKPLGRQSSKPFIETSKTWPRPGGLHSRIDLPNFAVVGNPDNHFPDVSRGCEMFAPITAHGNVVDEIPAEQLF